MFSAFKKLASKGDTAATSAAVVPEHVGQSMSGSLQQKFARGVQYNMKIIIKGDRNVGKSCLLERLQGRTFVETYTPTEQIQVASIQWSFKATEDVVKVEVWDVVDRGKARAPQTTGLKMNLSKDAAPPPDIPALDAEFLDVYKGTHGVVMMMDVTKLWTFEYIGRELPKVPEETPVLVLGNHCDMGHHRVVTEGQAIGLIEQIQETRKGQIMYGESSMRNGFGLRLLHKFLGLPFLRLQRDTLMAQLERNLRDMDICTFEVSEFLKSDDSDYNKFLDQLVNKRRQVADSKSNTNVVQCNPLPATSATGGQISSIPELRPTKSIIVGGGQPIVIPGQLNITNDPKFRQEAFANTSAVKPSNALTKIAQIQNKIATVEDFCPEGVGGLDKSFLDDLDGPSGITNSTTNNRVAEESDTDDESKGNPLVSRFQDDHDDEDSKPEPVPQDIFVATPEVRLNPLAKTSRSRELIFESSDFAGPIHSNSSTDLDVAVEVEVDEIDSNKDVDFDSWINDAAQRRSPEGGEDPTSSRISVSQEPSFPTSKLSPRSSIVVGSKEDVNYNEESEKAVEKVKKHKKKKERTKEENEKREKKKKRKSKDRDSNEPEDCSENLGREAGHEEYECI